MIKAYQYILIIIMSDNKYATIKIPRNLADRINEMIVQVDNSIYRTVSEFVIEAGVHLNEHVQLNPTTYSSH
jgi:hypothetical protein